ncbi:protein MEMO1 [Agrilus planipennis]|uniref:Protein MEMO1 n=1 Tax=Agrilus planipennis TaxID=224129 RepID=A0A1W4WQR2_AGRPL|nr:protein MEMO1 [Agrilus planipennis]
MSITRSASHAGSWYNSKSTELSNQLGTWIEKVDAFHSPAKAIIAPHAGYRYCGSCSAFAYKQIDPSIVKRIFIFGPSHFSRFSGCALPEAEKYETPFYDLTVDLEVIEELKNSKHFESVDLNTDETEHSIEMHLPFIAKIMENHKSQFSIVPVLVGSLSAKQESLYGQIFAKYLLDSNNLFIISSDFCHWGKRFSFTYYDNSHQEIFQSIEQLDRMGMKIIEEVNPEKFGTYLKKYGNTICGRNPILILLRSIEELIKTDNSKIANLKFLNYSQSQKCRQMSDSSVSYAAGVLVLN